MKEVFISGVLVKTFKSLGVFQKKNSTKLLLQFYHVEIFIYLVFDKVLFSIFSVKESSSLISCSLITFS